MLRYYDEMNVDKNSTILTNECKDDDVEAMGKIQKSSWHIAFLPSEYRFDICVHVFLCIKTHAFAGFVVAFRVSCHHTLLELQETPKTKGG